MESRKPPRTPHLLTTAGTNPANRPFRKRLVRVGLAAFAIAGATVLVQLPIFDRWFSIMDEGHMLLFADQVNQGRLLYRDMTIYPLPGAFYGLALVFALFEPSILVSRWLVVLEFAAFVALLWLWMRRMVAPAWAIAAVGALWVYRVWSFPHWQMYNYSTTALLLLVASAVALLHHLERGRLGSLWLAGLLFGLGVFCKQDYAAAALVATLATLAVACATEPDARFTRSALHFLGPAAMVGAAAGLHFFAQGQLGHVVQMTVLKHFVGLSTYEYQAFPPLWPVFGQDPVLRDLAGIHNNFPTIVTTVDGARILASPWFRDTAVYDAAVKAFLYGPWLFLAGGAVRLWRRRADLRGAQRTARLAELLLLGFGAATVALAHTYRPQDYVHFAVLYWPLVSLGVLYTADALAALRARPALRWAAALAVALPAAGFVAYTGQLAWKLRTLHDTPIPLARAGVYAQAGQARMLSEVTEYLRENTAPDERVAVLPYFSIAHFLADRFGPHASSYIVWPFPEYPDRDQRIVDAMQVLETQTVLYNFTQFPNFPPLSEYAATLYDYLVEHFETDRVFNDAALGFKLAALRRAPPPAGTSLAPEMAAASVWLVPDEGRERPWPAEKLGRAVEQATWPFRSVVAIRPAVGGATAVRIPISVPQGGHLRTAVGVHPDVWFQYPPAWVRFEIAVRGPSGRELLFERTLDPHQVLADRGWFDVDIPLLAYAGQRIEIELSTATSSRVGADPRMGGFGDPRLVVEAEIP